MPTVLTLTPAVVWSGGLFPGATTYPGATTFPSARGPALTPAASSSLTLTPAS